MAKSNIIPPSLQPRRVEKKPIPQTFTTPEPDIQEKEVPPPTPAPVEQAKGLDKKRFTLWLPSDVFRAFKIHTAGNDGSASAYIEELIRRDLKI